MSAQAVLEAPERTAHQPRVVHMHGCDVDEDMWDRVVAHWQAEAGRVGRSSLSSIERVRRALCEKTLGLRLELDGPRLLSVTPMSLG